MLVGAFVGWLVEEICGAGVEAGARTLGLSSDERTLRKALETATNLVTQSVPESAREPLAAALRERLNAPPAVASLELGADLREGLREAFRIQLAPLSDPEITGVGRSFLDEIGIKELRLADKVAEGFFESIRLLAAESGVSTFALLLEMEKFRSETRRYHRPPGSVPAAAVDGLPRDTPDFTDREDAVRLLVMRDIPRPDGATPVLTINGMAGVGKTALAVRMAHHVAVDYPDYRIFLNLHAHSMDRAPVTVESALESLLHAVGLTPAQIPGTIDDRLAVWRSALGRKRALILLDNAATAAQVRPLLPASADSLVIITSRRSLTELEGTAEVCLEVLSPADAVTLFTRITGVERIREDTRTAERIVAFCGYLPLAIRVVAARFRRHSSWSLGDLLDELEASRDRLKRIDEGGTSVMPAFELSYRALAPDQQRMFRLLAIHPEHEFSAYAAAALNGSELASAKRILEELHSQHLVSEPRHQRYVLHDLVHAYARHLTQEEDTEAERDAALDRLIDYYICAAERADRLINLLGHRAGEDTEARPGSPLDIPPIGSHPDAIRWAERERPNLHACLHLALDTGRLSRATRLARAIAYFLRLRGYWDETLDMCGRLAGVCDSIGDRRSAAYMRFIRGDIYRLTSQSAAALDSYREALDAFRETGDRHQEARVLHSIGDIERSARRYGDALKTYEAALSVYRELGHSHAEARALHSIADTYRNAGRYDEAFAEYEPLLDRYQELADPIGRARVQFGIADIYRSTGRFGKAVAESGATVDAFRTLGDRLGEADALRCLGEAHLGAGDAARADGCLSEAAAAYRELGDRHGEAQTSRALARLAQAGGDDSQALGHLQKALTLLQSLGSPDVADVRDEIARVQG